MGGFCSTEVPDVEITPEQMQEIAGLVQGNRYYKAVETTALYLVPEIAQTLKNDVADTDEAFQGDQMIINSDQRTAQCRDQLQDFNYSVKYALEQVAETVQPLAVSLLGPGLKSQIDDDVPEFIKDKAVDTAIEKAVEQVIEKEVRKIVVGVMHPTQTIHVR